MAPIDKMFTNQCFVKHILYIFLVIVLLFIDIQVLEQDPADGVIVKFLRESKLRYLWPALDENSWMIS